MPPISYGNKELPDELKFRNTFQTEVTILVGENGSGKSRLLAQLADHFKGESKVIGIANSIFDKFPDNAGKLQLLRDRTGGTR